MVAYHRSLWVRCVAASALLAVMALGVMVATDEGGSTLAMRAARLCAFTPALAALGAAATLSLARARGEQRALFALGVSPWRMAFGATLGAWSLGAIAIAGLALPWTDVHSLFPVITAGDVWLPRAGALVNPVRGIAVSADGIVRWVGSHPQALSAGPGRAAALSCFAPLAVATPAWVSAPIGGVRRAADLALTFCFALLLLHAVAAGRAVAWALPFAALPLALSGLVAYRRPR